MEFLEEISSEETTEVPEKTSDLMPEAHKIMATEILSSKTRRYFNKSKKSETTLMQITFSLGMGSVWRFPYLCHKNGAGSFILIYALMLLLLGVPLLSMEMIMAHWLQVDNIQAWRHLVPSMGGIGYVSVLMNFFLSSYYSILVTWNFFYLVSSFDFPLPWDHCTLGLNKTNPDLSCLQTVSPHYFWYRTALRSTEYMETGVQVVVLHLLLLNLAVWIFLFLTMTVAVHHSMVLEIFSLFLLLLILFCLLIRGFFLGTAMLGLKRMITTQVAWFSLDLWRQAGGHVMYSLGLGLGTMSNPAYKPVDNNYVRMASLVVLVNLFVSLLATSIIFTILEYWVTSSGPACVMNVAILKQLIKKHLLPDDTLPPPSVLQGPPKAYIDWVRSLRWPLQNQILLSAPSCSIKVHKNKFLDNPSLAFVAFSQAVSLLDGANFWAILFFLSQCIMGLNSMKRIMDSIVYPVQSTFSMTLHYRKAALAIMCLSSFLGSIFYASQSGSFIFRLFDDYMVPLCLIVIVIIQSVTLVCIYGIHRVRERLFYDIGLMLWPLFTCLWCYVMLPLLLLLAILAFFALGQTPSYALWNSTLNEEVRHPYLLRTKSWVLYVFFMIFLPIPIYLCYQYVMPTSGHTSSGNTQVQWNKGPSVMVHNSMWTKTNRAESAVHDLSSTQQVSQRSSWRSQRNHSWSFRGGSMKLGHNSLELPHIRLPISYSSLSPTQSVQGSALDTSPSYAVSEDLSGASLSRENSGSTDNRTQSLQLPGSTSTVPPDPGMIPEYRRAWPPKIRRKKKKPIE